MKLNASLRDANLDGIALNNFRNTSLTFGRTTENTKTPKVL